MSNWKRLMNKFMEDKAAAGWSPNTIEAGARWLNKFLRWCGEQGVNAPSEVTAAHVSSYRQFLLCTPARYAKFYTLCSVDQGMRMVRQFFHWATTRQHLLINPTQGLILPRIETCVPQLTPEDVETILQMAEGGGTLNGIRNRAVLETVYRAGARRSEVLQLSLGDVDRRGRTLRIEGRGGERRVQLDEHLFEILGRYLTDVRPQFATRRSRRVLFLTNTGAPYDGGCLQQMTLRLSARLGFRVTSHMLRHACAVHMLAAGADLQAVQQQLGHQKVQTTALTYANIATAAISRNTRVSRRPGERKLTHFLSLVEELGEDNRDV